jgi:2,4-dienoyl-CoA reductase (NADPH2)
VLAHEPDLVVCAAGATPEPSAFPAANGARVVTVWDLLGGAVTDAPTRAVVVDDGSGFWHSISAVEYLAESGAKVELLTPAPGVALSIPHESARNVAQRLGAHGVRVRVLARVVAVDGERVSLTEGFAAEPAETEADLVVVRTALRANDELARALDGVGPAVTTIGDASAPRRLNHAVFDANLAIRAFDAGRLQTTAFALS